MDFVHPRTIMKREPNCMQTIVVEGHHRKVDYEVSVEQAWC